MTSCKLVQVYRRSGGACYIQFQAAKAIRGNHIPNYTPTYSRRFQSRISILSSLSHVLPYNIYFCVTLVSPFVTKTDISVWVAAGLALVLRRLQSESLSSAQMLIPIFGGETCRHIRCIKGSQTQQCILTYISVELHVSAYTEAIIRFNIAS